MKSLHRKRVLFAATLMLLGAGAALQTVASAQTEPLPEVLVDSGPVTRSVVARGTATYAPIERTAVDYRVHYSDLDLGKHADVLTLQERIEMAARGACDKLDEQYPVHSSPHQTRACVAEAVQGASAQMQQAIANGQGDTRQE